MDSFGYRINLVSEGDKTYFRFDNDYSIEIKEKIQKQYGKDLEVALTTSGMNAIYSSIVSIMSKWNWDSNTNIVLGDEMYTETAGCITNFNKFYFNNKVKIFKVKIENDLDIIDLFEKNNKNKRVIFLLEPCTNPNGNVFNFSIIPKLRELCKQLVIIADITWTPDLNAIDLGVDIIVVSLTKHHSGSGCIMGTIINKTGLHLNINKYIKSSGIHISPYSCYILNDRINDMNERLEKAHNEVNKLAIELEKKYWVKKVNYPLLESHNSYKLAKKYEIRPTVLNVLMDIPGTINTVKEWLSSRENINFATSYGGKDSRIDPWFKNQKGTSYYWVRISVGYESKYEDIINSLERW